MGALSRPHHLALAFSAGLAACAEELADRPALVDRPRIVAIVASPPETRPGVPSTFHVVVATPDGPLASPRGVWAFCTTPKPLTENNTVNSDCLTEGVTAIKETGQRITAAVPGDACARFGPDTPPGDARPRDPDTTGGFFQPLRVGVDSVVGIGLHRITCNLANAPASVAGDYRRLYRPNQNPELLPLVARDGETALALEALPAGRPLTLEASWRPEDAETYVSFDLRSQALVPRREAMSVSWFATDGTFARATTGRTESDSSTFSTNEWTAPPASRTIHLWVVLRDSRGGVAVATHALRTVP